MSTAMLTADWFLLGRDTYYRKFEIYTMEWQQVYMDNVLAAAAAYGGPIAIIRDKTKLIKIHGSGKPIISIFTSSGKQLASIVWNKGQLVTMGWSVREELLCVQEDGTVDIYDLFGRFIHSFGIGSEAYDSKIIDAKVFTSALNTTGVAVMTSKFKFLCVNNVYDPKKRQHSELPRPGPPPACWCVVSEDKSTEVLAAKDKELYRLKQDEHRTCTALEADISHKYTQILEMAISINARHVVLFTDAGWVWLGSSDLRTKYCEIDTNFHTRPKQLVWCGTEAVIGVWDYNLLIVGRHGERADYIYDSSVHLVPEIDGVRVLSNMQHELVQKVPDVVQKIFRINSTDPGSFLLEASKQFQKRSHRANEYICLVKNELLDAVQQCIKAAGFEFDTDIQKMLIRAAQFGKCFLENYDPNFYVNMCRWLRVLNGVRDRRIGIPLTYTQGQYLSSEALINRLLTRRQYYLAIQIAKYLRLPENEGTSRILVHWAKYKVEHGGAQDEEIIAKEISNKLGYSTGISYSDIADAAIRCGRKRLACKLLTYEPKASEQVQLLLKLDEKSAALRNAIESGDTDLVYTVILRMRDVMGLGDFKLAIRNFPVAHALYIKYCLEHNSQALSEIYIQEDDFNSQAACALQEAFKEINDTKEAALLKAQDAFRKGRNELHSSMCEEQLRLLKQQKIFEDKLKQSFSHKSVHSTCNTLLVLKEVKLADKFRADFKIPERRYWWMRVENLAEQGEWTELERLSKSKKSPIGYGPFVDVCLKKDKKTEALKYLPRIADEFKVKYYMKADRLEDAAQIAFEQKDLQSLLYVQSRCVQQSNLMDKINGYLTQLGSKK